MDSPIDAKAKRPSLHADCSLEEKKRASLAAAIKGMSIGMYIRSVVLADAQKTIDRANIAPSKLAD